jgi:hypothetical protein
VPSQRLGTGELAFLAEGVPGFGARRYSIAAGRGPAGGSARAEGARLAAGPIEAAVDPASGAVGSLRWTDGRGRELVAPGPEPGLAHYLYIPGLDPGTARTVSSVRIRTGEPGPLVASLIVESGAPGAKGLVREYRVVDGRPRFEMAVTIDKTEVREKEGVHIAFPFAGPGGPPRIDVGWGFVRPELDQIAGACRDFFSARDGVDISGPDFGLTWTSLDAPLVEVGAVTDESPRRGERRLWLDRIEPSARLYSYAMNNYWHTNYKADQEGPVTLRYAVTPHRGSDGSLAKRLELEASTPLVPVAADPSAPVPRLPLVIEGDAFVATRLRPTTDGAGWVLRLYNASSRPAKLVVSGSAAAPGRVLLSDIEGAPGTPLAGPVEVPAAGILTLLIR